MQSTGGIDSNRWAIEMLSVKEENRSAPTSSIRITSSALVVVVVAAAAAAAALSLTLTHHTF